MSTPPTSLCLSCSSTIPSKSSSSVFKTPCCDSPICDACLNRNPRLRTYTPCLICGTAERAIRAGSGRGRGAVAGVKAEGAVRPSRKPSTDDQFSLGDDSDDESPTSHPTPPTPGTPNIPTTSPPPYTTTTSSPDRVRPTSIRSTQSHIPSSTTGADSQRSRSSSVASQRLGASGQLGALEAVVDQEEEEEEEVVVKHFIKRGETVRGLAAKYKVDPYDLLKINSLPYEALQTNPSLIQTRKFILLSRPKSSGKSRDVELGEGGVNVEEDEKRREERRVKRFQLITKQADPSIARAYLAVQALSGAPGEVLFNFEEEEKKAPRGEMAAVDRFFEDDDWEGEQVVAGGSGNAAGGWGGKGKGRGKGRMKTGELVRGAPWFEKGVGGVKQEGLEGSRKS